MYTMFPTIPATCVLYIHTKVLVSTSRLRNVTLCVCKHEALVQTPVRYIVDSQTLS